MPQANNTEVAAKQARRQHTIHLDPAVHERIAALAKADDRSFNRMVERLLADALNRAAKAD